MRIFLPGIRLSKARFFRDLAGFSSPRAGVEQIHISFSDMHGLSGKCKWSVIFTLFLSVICVLIFCEYLIYYPAILHCSWSELNGNSGKGLSNRPSFALCFSRVPTC